MKPGMRDCSLMLILFEAFSMMIFIALCSSVELRSDFGLKNYQREFIASDVINISVESFGYYLIINEIPEDAVIKEYTSINGIQYSLNSEVNVPNLQLFRYIAKPYAYQVINLPTGGRISFAFGCLQDICQTGAIISNSPQDIFVLSNSNKDFYHIGADEDKCLILTSPSTQRISLYLDGIIGKVYLYENNLPLRAYTGTTTLSLKVDAISSPSVFRFVSNNNILSDTFSISMGSIAPEPYKTLTLFHHPYNSSANCPTKECSFLDAIHFNVIEKYTVLLIVLSVIITVLYYVFSQVFCPKIEIHHMNDEGLVSKEVSGIWPSHNIKGENQNGPKGYYIMDPILRPVSD